MYHGWLILDKPTGITSARALSSIKRMLHASLAAQPGRKGEFKIGHAGTLDPLASGVLPLAFGEATKTVGYAMDGRKSYYFRVAWGQERTTEDAAGEVTAISQNRPCALQIEAVLPQFTGHIMQMPPAYSALKINGQRAYALARAGQEVVLQPRLVSIERLEINDIQPDSAAFTVWCGKGTYVRSLARDMARALGTCGHISELKRLSVGNFCLMQAISLEKLEELVHKAEIAKCLQPVESVLDDIPAWELDSNLARMLAHGGVLALDCEEVRERQANLPSGKKGGTVWQVLHEGRLVAMATIEQGLMKPVRVFNWGG